MEILIQLVFFLMLLGIGYFVGLHFEQKHYAEIKHREKRLLACANDDVWRKDSDARSH